MIVSEALGLSSRIVIRLSLRRISGRAKGAPHPFFCEEMNPLLLIGNHSNNELNFLLYCCFLPQSFNNGGPTHKN